MRVAGGAVSSDIETQRVRVGAPRARLGLGPRRGAHRVPGLTGGQGVGRVRWAGHRPGVLGWSHGV